MFNPVTSIKKTWVEIPAEVQTFLKKVLAIFIVWKLLYTFILFPLKTPDTQLRNATSWGTIQLLKLKFPQSIILKENKVSTDKLTGEETNSDIILKDNRKIIGIADACNGLELYVLYIAFLLCFSAKWTKIITYVLVGSAVIYVGNILRCYFISLMNIDRFNLIEVAHHYVFKLVMYAVIFSLWVLFLKTKKQKLAVAETK
ncbi:MAG: archaeosortase/exosortase family protein [Bacteroidetes bacterium]|nr:archaeosortase/exosortase family protein [Bacteroidota bacterium]MBS1627781.1 archaeosortase/exosortase family protein [Bacteroidota bacterium]MBS1649810.1 archaeosortase/exosortase family protein [Bacteroidota bacterium]